jgi:hypothetical protein
MKKEKTLDEMINEILREEGIDPDNMFPEDEEDQGPKPDWLIAIDELLEMQDEEDELPSKTLRFGRRTAGTKLF